MLPTIQQAAEPEVEAAAGRRVLNAALVAYATELAEAYGTSVSASQLQEAGLLIASTVPLPVTLEERRAVFAPITQLIADRAGTPVDRVKAAHLRHAARVEAEAAHHAASDAPEPARSGAADGRYLNVEFIAIYW